MSTLEDSYYIDPANKQANHIGLTCKQHPHLKWHTKNISPVGCRRIYSNQDEECDCPVSKLVLAKKEKDEQPAQ